MRNHAVYGSAATRHWMSVVIFYNDVMASRLKIQQTLSEKAPHLTVSLRTLSRLLDAHRSSVRRWLGDAGVRPVVLGRGRNGAIRYRWCEIEQWLASLEYAD